jgi:hypothetical protein
MKRVIVSELILNHIEAIKDQIRESKQRKY